MALDEYRAHREFPLLGDFENKSELSRWEGGARLSRDTEVSQQGNYSAKITMTTDHYSGVSLRHFPGDWSGWTGLAFSVFNPDREFELYYRVHDILHRGDMQEYSNRFNGKNVLHHGWNDIVIPISLRGQVLNYHISCPGRGKIDLGSLKYDISRPDPPRFDSLFFFLGGSFQGFIGWGECLVLATRGRGDSLIWS